MDKCKCGSYAINHRSHGRDGSDGDLCDVCYWRKRANSPQQLKTKIAEIIDKYERLERIGSLNRYGVAHDLMKEFRQLSAV